MALRYYKTDTAFRFEPAGAGACLEISRPDGMIRVSEPTNTTPTGTTPTNTTPTGTIHAIMGVISLLAGPYIIAITEHTVVGRLLGHDVYHVDAVQIWPVAEEGTVRVAAGREWEEEEHLRVLRLFLASGGFYYSRGYDLTSSLQSRGGVAPPAPTPQTVRTVITTDTAKMNMFVANRALLGTLLEAVPVGHLQHLIAICIYGFVGIHHQPGLSIALVSRRSAGRVGTRYHSRGVDDLGHVSNFVETEQIVVCAVSGAIGAIGTIGTFDSTATTATATTAATTKVSSLVQCRGSIPLYWRQTVDMKYAPTIDLYNHDSNEAVMRRHVHIMKEKYHTPIVMVNLINQRGAEAVLHRALSTYHADLGDAEVKLVNWDFHEHCRKMQWHNVQLLMDELEADLALIGSFEATCDAGNAGNAGGAIGTITTGAIGTIRKVTREQHGIIRTNCMDCLDRTNVVQSLIAKRVLQQFLDSTNTPKTPQIDTIFQHLWADNADAISRQYSGTGALKTDYTRTGKRTLHGQYRDLVNSVTRYAKGNLFDADTQDAMDLFFGAYSVHGTPLYPDLGVSHNVRIAVPLLVVLVSALLIAKIIFTRTTPLSPLPPTMATILLAGCIFATVKLVVWRGSVFARLPRLNPPPTAARGDRARARPTPGLKAHII